MAKRAKSKPKAATPADTTTHESSTASPEAVVRGFIADMHEWELWCAATSALRDKAKAADPSHAHELHLKWQAEVLERERHLFARWCTPKDRKFGRLGSYSRPPEYQPENEHVIDVTQRSAKRAEVQTDRKSRGHAERRMYVVLKHAGQWRLDSVKWLSPATGAWVNGGL